jgi:hypothetical protein
VEALRKEGAPGSGVLLHVVLEALEVRGIPVDERLDAYVVGARRAAPRRARCASPPGCGTQPRAPPRRGVRVCVSLRSLVQARWQGLHPATLAARRVLLSSRASPRPLPRLLSPLAARLPALPGQGRAQPGGRGGHGAGLHRPPARAGGRERQGARPGGQGAGPAAAPRPAAAGGPGQGAAGGRRRVRWGLGSACCPAFPATVGSLRRACLSRMRPVSRRAQLPAPWRC